MLSRFFRDNIKVYRKDEGALRFLGGGGGGEWW